MKKASSLKNLKIYFKVEIPMFDGSFDVGKTLYDHSTKEKITFAMLKPSKHALMCEKSVRKQGGRDLLWKKFKALFKKQFYVAGFFEERWYK